MIASKYAFFSLHPCSPKKTLYSSFASTVQLLSWTVIAIVQLLATGGGAAAGNQAIVFSSPIYKALF